MNSIFVLIIFLTTSFADVHLNKYNLALVCECDIFTERIFLSSKNITLIDPGKLRIF
jgi:hypothetical protein